MCCLSLEIGSTFFCITYYLAKVGILFKCLFFIFDSFSDKVSAQNELSEKVGFAE